MATLVQARDKAGFKVKKKKTHHTHNSLGLRSLMAWGERQHRLLILGWMEDGGRVFCVCSCACVSFFFFEDSGTCVSFGERCDRAGEVNVVYVFIYPFFLSFSCACEEVMFIFLFCFLVYFHFVFFFFLCVLKERQSGWRDTHVFFLTKKACCRRRKKKWGPTCRRKWTKRKKRASTQEKTVDKKQNLLAWRATWTRQNLGHEVTYCNMKRGSPANRCEID